MTKVIKCAACGSEHTHHDSVVVYNRAEDDRGDGLLVGIHAQDIVQLGGEEGPRRDGVRVLLNCEICDANTVLEIVQHKGQTLISTRKAPVPLDEICEDYLYYLEAQAERHFAEVAN